MSDKVADMLINRFMSLEFVNTYSQAKGCALIAVDVILNTEMKPDAAYEASLLWNKVKCDLIK